MKTVVHLDGKPVIINFPSFEKEIFLDDLTSIDYGNIYGEAVTVSALIAKIGTMRAEAEKLHSEKKLELDIFEASNRKSLRQESTRNAGKVVVGGDSIKLTENALDELITTNPEYALKKQALIEAKRQYEYMDAIFWAISSKDKKLNNVIKAITPEELYDELVEGSINGMMIEKAKMKYHNR